MMSSYAKLDTSQQFQEDLVNVKKESDQKARYQDQDTLNEKEGQN